MTTPILDRIQALISRAAHPGTPEEEARSSAFITVKLISKHGVSLSLGQEADRRERERREEERRQATERREAARRDEERREEERRRAVEAEAERDRKRKRPLGPDEPPAPKKKPGR
jgi:hypothetical protein